MESHGGPGGGTCDSTNGPKSKKEKAREFLESQIVPILQRALTEMCIQEPSDPITWLAMWLQENHPEKSVQQAVKAAAKQILVHKCNEGDFFGEIALLNSVPRQATVKAAGPTTLLALRRDAFERLCGSLFEILRRDMSKYSDLALPDGPEDGVQVGAEEEINELEHSEQHEVVDEDPPAARAYINATGRRRSDVFQEAVRLEQGWTAPAFPKTAEEMIRLDGYIGNTALLKHLDTKLRTTIIQERTHTLTAST